MIRSRSLVVIFAILMALLAVDVVNASITYNRSSATGYALTYVYSPNRSFVLESDDCTNFASQALLAGGWTTVNYGYFYSLDDTDEWFYSPYFYQLPRPSYSWINAAYLGAFMLNSNRAIRMPSPYDLLPGDIIQIQPPGKSINHTAIVVSKDSNGEPWIAQHSSPWPIESMSSAMDHNPGATFFNWRVRDYYNVNRSVVYSAHVQNIGWMQAVANGTVAGTTGQSLRMEAIKIALTSGHIYYQAHVQNIGWMSPVADGAVAGTTGQSLRMEAIRIWTDYGHVTYYCHVQNIGWMGPFRDGQIGGTTGMGLRMEAIQIEVSD